MAVRGEARTPRTSCRRRPFARSPRWSATQSRSPRAWWLSVVRNTALTFMARHRPGALTFVGDLDDLDAMEAAPDRAGRTPEPALIAREEGERVRAAIAALPSPLRETLVMREINGLNYREIAEATERRSAP